MVKKHKSHPSQRKKVGKLKKARAFIVRHSVNLINEELIYAPRLGRKPKYIIPIYQWVAECKKASIIMTQNQLEKRLPRWFPDGRASIVQEFEQLGFKECIFCGAIKPPPFSLCPTPAYEGRHGFCKDCQSTGTRSANSIEKGISHLVDPGLEIMDYWS
ncbi:hypothetical protein ADUPG1_013802 [Aduncisulcus paluster]|uniref:Uncharacterized protein n=1 Tax=Aduncisulcus paluster TaxID=2918883 RepID=A0ABQ5K7H0_9EUKA|nr:hypothetical protein ADUPG1_013802 [Aduncisulcus paluster]